MGDWSEIIRDFIGYVREKREWWLLPALIVLFLSAFLLLTAGTAPVPVFVYPVA